MSFPLTARFARFLAPVLGLLASGLAWADERSAYNLPVGVTEISREVFGLHNMMLITVTVIGILVFGTMFYSVFAHRRSKHPKPADFHESTTVEIIWTIIPFVILVAVAIPAAGTLIKMEDVRDADLTVKVTGFQWGWKYDYIGENVGFTSTLAPESNAARQLRSGVDVRKIPNYLWEVNNPLVLPVGKKVRFLVTGQDVIHAWWVNDLAVKKDAIPGIINETWTRIDVAGTYRGVCAELCGRDHGFMPIVVQALPEPEYRAWLAKQKGVDVASLGTPPAAAAPAPDIGLPVVPGAAPAATTDAAVPTAAVATAATAAPAVPNPARIFFRTASFDLSAEDVAALAPLADYAKANPAVRLDISGYHDATGGAAKNAELAKQRAKSVQAALVKAGAPEASLVLKKPEQVNAGTADEARRVEVRVAPDAAIATAGAPAATTPAAGTETLTSTTPGAQVPVQVAAATAAPAAAAAATSAPSMTVEALMAQGKRGYETNCAACHQANGQGLPPNFPSLVGSKVVTGPIKAHIVHTIKGKGLMPPFGQLADADLAALLTYERNSWGNKAGTIQPADVKAAR